MALFRFSVTSISRGAGRKVVAAAAYRAGERLRDERAGKVHNFAARTDVTHKEILLPTGLDTSKIEWARDRGRLWNEAERAEHKRNSRTAREFLVTLPAELSADQRRDLAQGFAREVSDRYRVAVDLAVHNPRAEGDPRNYHAHLLLSSRELTPVGFGAKAGLDMQSESRRRLELPVGIAEIKAVRVRWATLTNEALRSAGLSSTVDHRSLRSQGLDRAPVHVPFGVFQRLRRALRKEKIQAVQQSHLSRVSEAHLHSGDASVNLQQIRQQSRDAWLKLRHEPLAADKKQEYLKAPERLLDDDVAL